MMDVIVVNLVREGINKHRARELAEHFIKHMTQTKQGAVAMKFKIYKPTVPDPTRQGINNALLPWVYDQDRSSGFDASMWVTPVATLPPQRTWVGLTDEELPALAGDNGKYMELQQVRRFYKYIEAKLKEKNT